jgi:hypothetical protein
MLLHLKNLIKNLPAKYKRLQKEDQKYKKKFLVNIWHMKDQKDILALL